MIDQIKKHEGFRSKAYKDAKTGKMAIGYGDTLGDTSRDITETEAHDRLVNRLASIEQELAKKVSRELTQNQQDALIDMAYNAGVEGSQKIIDRVNAGASDEEIAGALALYNKSTNVETGKKEVLPSLTERANSRASLWLKKVEDTLQRNPSVNNVFEDIQEEPSNLTPSQEKAKEDSLFGDIQEERVPLQTVEDKKFDLDFTGESLGEYQVAEVLRKKEARRLAEKINKPYEEVYTELYTKSAKEVLAQNAHGLTAEHFPATLNWSLKDDTNYVLMREKENYPHRVEARVNRLKPSNESDFVKALKMNPHRLKRAGVWAGFLSGTVPLEDIKAAIVSLNEEQEQLTLSEGVQKVSAEAEKKWDKAEGLDAFIDMAKTYIVNPQETALMAMQNLGGFAGTALAFTGNPVGIAGAVAIGAGLSMDERMAQNLEPFRDPETGIIDVDKAFSDPNRIAEWKNGLAVYAGAMGAAEAALGFLWGKNFVKVIPRGVKSSGVGKAVSKVAQKTMSSQIAGPATVAGAKILSGAVEEGTGQFVASAAADIAEGKELTEGKISEYKKDAAVEAVFGAFMSGTVASFGIPGHVKSIRAINKIKESTKANVDAVNVSEARAAVQENETLADDKEEVKELIKEVTKTKEDDTEDLANVGEDIDTSDDEPVSIVKEMEKIQNNRVEIAPSEWDAHHIEMGIEPGEAIKKLSPQVQAAYLKNKLSDASFSIPHEEWLTYTKDELDPSVDMIARVNGNNLNAKEANAIVEEAESDPTAMFSIRPDDETPPPVPGEEAPPVPVGEAPVTTTEEGEVERPKIALPSDVDAWTFYEWENKDGTTTARPITLTQYGNTETEQKIADEMVAAIKFSTEHAGDIDPALIETVVRFQLGHMKTRAKMIDTTLEELAKQLRFGKMKKSEEVTKKGITLGRYQAKSFFDGIAKIAFGTRADPFTILHELGHSWLQEMTEDYQFIKNIPEERLRADQKEYKEVMDTTAKLLNLENIGVIQSETDEMVSLFQQGLEESERFLNLRAKRSLYHETFAQTSEKYFIDGEFKNSKIRAMLMMFKKWLRPFAEFAGLAYKDAILRFYKNGEETQVIGIPFLRIRPEVERIFDVILGATEAAENTVVPMFPDPMFPVEMLGPEGPEYMEAYTASLGEAIGETYQNIINKSIRKREKEIRKAENEIYKKAEGIVDQRPSMRILQFFEENPTAKLSLESVAEVMFNGKIDDAIEFRNKIPKSIIASRKKGGADAKMFMLQAEISDVEILKNLLLETARRDDLVQAEFNEIVKKEFPILKTDDEIHAEAVKAMNLEGREKLLDKELKILATRRHKKLAGIAEKAINPASTISKASKEMIKEKAKTTVLKSSLGGFNPAKWLRDSERHGRRAAEYFRAGDIMKSFDMKYAQSINFYAFKVAEDVKSDVAKAYQTIQQIKDLKVSTNSVKKYDINLVNFMKAFVDHIEGNAELPILGDEGTIPISERTPIKESDIIAINTTANMLSKFLGGATEANRTIEAHIMLGNYLRMIAKLSKELRKVTIAGETKLAIDAANSDIALMGTVKPISFEIEGLNATMASKRRAYALNMPSLLKGLFKSDSSYATSFIGKIMQEIKNGEAQKAFKFTEYEKRYANKLKACIKARKEPLSKSIHGPIVRRIYSLRTEMADPIFAPQLGITFRNRNQLFAACLHALGSESGMQKFLAGNAKGKTGVHFNAFIADAIHKGILIKEDFEFFQEVWDVNEEIFPLVRKEILNTENREIGKIEAKPFTNLFGTFRGGYYHAAPSADARVRMFSWFGTDDKPNNVDIVGMYPTRQTGATKERTDAVYELDLDLRNVTRYLSTSLNIAYLMGPMENLSRYMNTPQMFNFMESARPGAIKEVIAPFFERTKNQIYTEFSRSFFDNLTRYLRNNANTMIYFGNFVSASKQFLGLGPAVVKVGAKNISRALKMTSTAPRATRKFIEDRSPMMKERLQTSQRDMYRSITELDTNFDWVSWTDDKVKNATFILSQKTQNVVDMVTWRAAFVKATAELGMNEREASIYADDVVNSTQGSPAVSEMSRLQAGTDVIKAFMAITTVPIAMSNLASVEMHRNQTDKNRMAFLVKLALFSITVPALMQLELGDDDEDDKKSDIEKHNAYMADLAATHVWGAIDLAIPLASRLKEGMRTLPGPTYGTIAKTADTIKNVKNSLVHGVDMTDAQENLMLDHLSFWLGNGVFTLAKRVNKIGTSMKSNDEIRYEKQNRRYQLQELRYEEKYE